MKRFSIRGLGRRRRTALSAGLLATAALAVGAPSAMAATSVGWQSFPHVSTEDVIELRHADGVVDRSQIQVCLETGTGITWQKGFDWQARRRTTTWWGATEFPYVTVASARLSGENARTCRTQPLNDAYNTSYYTSSDANRRGRLIFGKAKFLGIYTQMYVLSFDRMTAVGGRSYTFRWVEDNGPN